MKKIGLLLTVFALLSCHRHEKPSVEDHFQKIQERIDRKEYQEAEAEVNSILESEPQNERARMILASISVHRAGITLKDFFYLEKLVRLEEKPTLQLAALEGLEKLEVSKQSALGKSFEFLQQVNLIAGRAQEIADKFEQIPVVSDESAQHLQAALTELGKIESPQDGNALYRGVIKLFYFKYLWKTGYFLKFGGKNFCSNTVSILQLKLSEFDSYVGSMILDVGRGFPKSRHEFERHAVELSRGVLEAQKFLYSIQKKAQTVEQLILSLARDQEIEGVKCDF